MYEKQRECTDHGHSGKVPRSTTSTTRYIIHSPLSLVIPLVQGAQWAPSLSCLNAHSSLQAVLTFTYSLLLSHFLPFYIRSHSLFLPFLSFTFLFLCLFFRTVRMYVRLLEFFSTHSMILLHNNTKFLSLSLSLSLSLCPCAPWLFFSLCSSRTLLLRNDKTRRWIGLFEGAKVLSVLTYGYDQMGCPFQEVVPSNH